MTDRNAPTGDHVCPWWFAYTFDNVLRRLVHDPPGILAPFLSEGMTVLDAGCGMGHFSIGMARIVGERGKVVAVDLQQKMLDVMMQRARKAGLEKRIIPRRCTPASLGLQEKLDFALAFWMVHEVPDAGRFFGEIHRHLNPGGHLLYSEPSFHVGAKTFRDICRMAMGQGFSEIGRPGIRFSRATLLGKS